MMKLDIGCGLHWKEPLNEWTHLDANPGSHIEIVCDFGKISLEDGSVDAIHLGDVVEHIPIWRQDEVLTEWRRIAKTGCVITGSTPNIDSVIRRFARGEFSFKDALIPNIYGWNDRPTEHHFINFTKDSLTALFAKHGFDVSDYSQSPGPVNEPLWLVFRGRKT
jgi:predicted SAM-dependent methyltransferase